MGSMKGFFAITILMVFIIGFIWVVAHDKPDNPDAPENKTVIEIKFVETYFGHPSYIKHVVLYPSGEMWKGWYAKNNSDGPDNVPKLNDYSRTKVSRKRAEKLLQAVMKVPNKKMRLNWSQISFKYADKTKEKTVENYTCKLVKGKEGGSYHKISISRPDTSDIIVRRSCNLFNKHTDLFEYRKRNVNFFFKPSSSFSKKLNSVVAAAENNTGRIYLPLPRFGDLLMGPESTIQ
ncbi:MAG: hypothetical protein SV760_01765 [Halobacteria archaeon]|nr:hypothetical protein [Halobacteria archaeon]